MIQESNQESYTMPSPVFREPVIQDETSYSSLIQALKADTNNYTPSTEAEPNVTEHEEVTGKPFTSKELGLDYDNLEHQDRLKVNKIESYIVSKIKTGQFKDSPDSGKDIISKIMSKLKLSDKNDPFFVLDKISEYMSVVKDPITERQQPDVKVVALKNIVKEEKNKNEKLKSAFKQLLKAL